MSVICLGPCCIPLSALVPFLLLLIKPFLNILQKTPLARFLPHQLDSGSKTRRNRAAGATTSSCCTDAACKDGVSTSDDDVTTVASLQQWEDLKREPLVITDFTASWCKPCRKMAPVFEGLAKEYKGLAVFCKVDIDDLPDVYDGISIPAFHVLKDGVKVDSSTGSNEDRLRTMVAQHCKKTK